MVEIPCPVCSSEERVPLLSGADHIHEAHGEFTLVKCAACGLVYLDPRPGPDEMSAHYGEDYRAWQSVPAKGLLARFRAMGVKRKVDAVASQFPAGRLLDVGCGYGDFLAGARQSGFEACGTELDPGQAERAAQASGAEVRAGDLETCGFEPESFGVITMWHVLEHLPDPLGALRSARELLKPGGMVVVAVPDAGSWAARLFRGYWAGYDMPRHLTDFSSETLEDVLSRSGFQPVSRSYFMGTFDNVRISTEFLIKGKTRPGTVRSLLLALAGNPLTRLLFTPLALALQRLGKGTVVTCFARRA
jgi:SAM-dependent methyltransferase